MHQLHRISTQFVSGMHLELRENDRHWKSYAMTVYENQKQEVPGSNGAALRGGCSKYIRFRMKSEQFNLVQPFWRTQALRRPFQNKISAAVSVTHQCRVWWKINLCYNRDLWKRARQVPAAALLHLFNHPNRNNPECCTSSVTETFTVLVAQYVTAAVLLN